jgi:hypothetical protein
MISLLAIVPVGLAAKFYRGWGRDWINDSSGGIFYVIFWCLLFFSLFPSRRNLWLIPLLVFFATCGVEFLQLWHPPLLEAMRSTLLGRLILGTTFVWGDFIYYAIGSVLGWLWLRSLWKVSEARS